MGLDLASISRARRSYGRASDESSEDSEDSDEEEGSSALQVALRDKEEALVQSALARIRRAQEKGKREVKLKQDELDALERRRKRMQSAATAKDRKGSGSSGGSGTERRRRSDRDLISVPMTLPTTGEPSNRKKGKSRKFEDGEPYPTAGAPPPGLLVAGADGIMYAPLGYYPQQSGSSRTTPTRPRSATSQQVRGTAPPQFAYQQGPTNRHFSDGTRPTSSSSSGSRRPLPDEEGWMPAHSRRNSVSSQPHHVDPFEYQISSEYPPPIPQQYMQPSGRRNVSGPAEVSYSSIRRSPPMVANYPASAWGRTSEPTLRRRSSNRDEQSLGSTSGDEEDDSDDLGNGVQVSVEEREVEREKDRGIARKAVGGGKKKGKGR